MTKPIPKPSDLPTPEACDQDIRQELRRLANAPGLYSTLFLVTGQSLPTRLATSIQHLGLLPHSSARLAWISALVTAVDQAAQDLEVEMVALKPGETPAQALARAGVIADPEDEEAPNAQTQH